MFNIFRSKRFYMLAAATLGAGMLPAYCQLTWTNAEMSVDAKLGDIKTVVAFPFVNETNGSITIKNVVPSCHCTVPRLEKKIYEPGESGQIEVTFQHENKVGVQRNTIAIETDSPEESLIQLNLIVKIPEWVEMKPPFVLWKRNAPAESKSITVKLADPSIELLEVKSDSPDFEVNRTTRDGETNLEVKPKSTEHASRSQIVLRAKLPNSVIRIYRCHAVVK